MGKAWDTYGSASEGMMRLPLVHALAKRLRSLHYMTQHGESMDEALRSAEMEMANGEGIREPTSEGAATAGEAAAGFTMPLYAYTADRFADPNPPDYNAIPLGIGAKVDKLVRAGKLSPETVARLPHRFVALSKEAQPLREIDPALVQKRYLQDATQAARDSLLRHKPPTTLDTILRTLRGTVDKGLVEEAAKRPANMIEMTPYTSAASTDMFTGKIQINPEGLVQYYRELNNLRNKPNTPIISETIEKDPQFGTFLRSVLGHEKGERAVLRGEAKDVPFASHVGPEARSREMEITSARDPTMANKLRDLWQGSYSQQEGPFWDAYKRAGGTAYRAIPSGGKQADAVVRTLRKLDAQGKLPDNFLKLPLEQVREAKRKAFEEGMAQRAIERLKKHLDDPKTKAKDAMQRFFEGTGYRGRPEGKSRGPFDQEWKKKNRLQQKWNDWHREHMDPLTRQILDMLDGKIGT